MFETTNQHHVLFAVTITCYNHVLVLAGKYLQGGTPSLIAKLVQITRVTMVYGG